MNLPDDQTELSLERSAGLSPTWVAVALLAVLAVLAVVGVVRLGQLIDRTDSLIVEQQRATCYERLQWLGDPFDDHPEGDDLRGATSRHCEGDAPLIGFEDD
ncbi:MAG TPA: hypothetical protein VMN58_12240 [Acidimicrobiales bacterium]|nr:hypothetical protein [Acidimicrobiales bacterium]